MHSTFMCFKFSVRKGYSWRDISTAFLSVSIIYIIGGSRIYSGFFEKADELHITFVNENTKNIDTYFPISIEKIENQFTKIEDVALNEQASYTHWLKNS